MEETPNHYSLFFFSLAERYSGLAGVYLDELGAISNNPGLYHLFLVVIRRSSPSSGLVGAVGILRCLHPPVGEGRR